MKKLLILTALLLSGCSGGKGSFCESNNYQGALCENARRQAIDTQQNISKNELSTILFECNDQLKRKIYKKRSVMLRKCLKPRVLSLTERTSPSEVEVISAVMSKQIMLTEMVEKKKITQAEADDIMDQYNLEQVNHRDQVNAVRAQQAMQLQQIQNQQNAIEREQFRQNTQPYYVPKRNMVNCFGNNYGTSSSVTCF